MLVKVGLHYVIMSLYDGVGGDLQYAGENMTPHSG